jgi:hypothetical protein
MLPSYLYISYVYVCVLIFSLIFFLTFFKIETRPPPPPPPWKA